MLNMQYCTVNEITLSAVLHGWRLYQIYASGEYAILHRKLNYVKCSIAWVAMAQPAVVVTMIVAITKYNHA